MMTMRFKHVVVLLTIIPSLPLLISALIYWLNSSTSCPQLDPFRHELRFPKQHDSPATTRDGGTAVDVPAQIAVAEIFDGQEGGNWHLSEHPDIDVRAKFQQKQIAKMCGHNFFRTEQEMPRGNELKGYFRHLIFDDKHKSIFCFVPKIGCTNLKRLVLYAGGNLPLNTVDWEWVEDKYYLEPALKHASLLNTSLSMKDKLQRLNSYYKFMFVRNPLERLVSAYRNKIEPPLSYSNHDKFPDHVKVSILNTYRGDELRQWTERNAMNWPHANISVTFVEYVRFFVEKDLAELNEHFRPSLSLCHPCLANFNFYGNFRNISTDVKKLIGKFGTETRFYRDESLHNSQEQTYNKLAEYYGKLPYKDRVQLVGKLYDELLFYYTLYPSQRHSHYHLLGIKQPVM